MNGLISSNKDQTMSSREIAEVVESRHDKVKQSIERLAERGVIQLPPMGDVKNHQGQTVSVYRVNKRDSYVVVAQLSPEFTAKLVDRWEALETGTATPAVKDPQLAAMVMMLTQLDTVKQEQESQRKTIEDIQAKLIASPEQFYTVAGYASLRGISVDTKRANLMGRKASKLSREYGVEIGTAHSSIYGKVNTYHVDILCELFEK